MKYLSKLVLPFLLSLPSSALAGASETIEVIAAKPTSKRPAKPSMALKLPPFSLRNQVFDFPTGLRVIMQSDRSHPIVSVFMVLDHGNNADQEGKNGSAHFVEHTWFRSQHGDLPPIMTLIQDLGVLFNATTRPDTTDYRTVASSEYLPALLRLESMRLTEPYRGVKAEHIKTEREVIRNEWRRRNEQNESLVADYLLQTVFPEGHPYHLRSTHETIDNIDLATLQAYMDENYKPKDTTIVVVGDFDPAEARSLIFANFDPKLLHPDLTADSMFRYPRPGIENPDKDNPEHWFTDAWDPNNPDEPMELMEAPKRRVSPDDRKPLPAPPNQDEIPEYDAAVKNKTIAVGWALPGGYRGDDINLQLVGGTANQVVLTYFYRKGLLDTEDYKRGLKNPGCGTWIMKEHSLLLCTIEVTDTKKYASAERVADMIIDQIPIMWNPELVQQRQKYFGAAKMQSMARTLRSVDDVAFHFNGRADTIGYHAHNTGSVTYHSDAMNEIMSVDMSVVAELAYAHLTRKRAGVVVLNKIKDEDIDTDGEHSSYHGASLGDDVSKGTDDLTAVTPDMIAETYIKPDLSQMVDKKLPNGLRVVIVPNGETPLVQASVVINGGTMGGDKGEASWAFRWMSTETHDPLSIAAERSFDVRSNTGSLGFRGPGGNLDGMLWFMREELEGLRPDMNYRSNYLRLTQNRIMGAIHGRAFHIRDMGMKHMYPNNPSYYPTQLEDIQQWKTWGSTEVRDYLDQHMQPANSTLLIVGNVDADEALHQAIEYFAGWEARDPEVVGQAPELKTPPINNNGSKVLVFHNKKRTQSQVTRMCRLNFEGVEDRQAVSVLSNLVREKTFTQLRVKEGLAYSPGGFAYTQPDGTGYLGFSSLAVNKGVGRTVEFFQTLTSDLEAGKFDDLSLKMYQLRRARSLGIQAQSTKQMTEKLRDVIAWDQPWSTMTDAGDHIASVDAADIKRLTEGCNGRALTTIEGPKDIIEPQLKEYNIEYEVVDWEERGNKMHEAFDPSDYKKYKKKADKKKKKADEKGEATADADEDDDHGHD